MSKGVKRKKKKNSIGTFFLGWLCGFVLTIGLIVGIFSLVYFYGSVDNINSIFKTNYTLGNDEIDGATFDEITNNLLALANNFDYYTLNDLESDFNVVVPSKVLGVDITDLKKVKFSEFVEKLKNKVKNLKFGDTGELLLGENDDLFNRTITYIYDGDEIKRVSGDAVSFSYNISGDDVYINNYRVSVIGMDIDGVYKTKISLNDLPIGYALEEFVNNLNELKINDVFSEFSGVLSLLSETDKQKDIGQLNELINNAIKDSSLSKLSSAGIISISDADLMKSIDGTTVGELKLNQAIEILLSQAQ